METWRSDEVWKKTVLSSEQEGILQINTRPQFIYYFNNIHSDYSLREHDPLTLSPVEKRAREDNYYSILHMYQRLLYGQS